MTAYRNIIIVLLILLIVSCNSGTEPEDEKNYWSDPSDEATMLYFRQFNSISMDSLVAGEIQFRLDIAKNVVEDTTIKVHKDWVFGELLLYTNEELYNNFDTTTLKFNYPPIDSLLIQYELLRMESHEQRLTSNFFHFLFPEYYNMLSLSKEFEKVNGIVAAEQNIIAGPPICKKDISLIIDSEVYQFIFYGACPNHFWEIHVVDDSIKFMQEWE